MSTSKFRLACGLAAVVGLAAASPSFAQQFVQEGQVVYPRGMAPVEQVFVQQVRPVTPVRTALRGITRSIGRRDLEVWAQRELDIIVRRDRRVPGHHQRSPAGTMAGTGSASHRSILSTCGPPMRSYVRSGHTRLYVEAVGRGRSGRWYMVRLWGR